MNIYTKNDALVIELTGLEQFWALKRRLVIPFDKLVSLEFHETWERPKDSLLRTGGTFLPKVLMAGHYRSGGECYFAYIKGIRGSGFGAVSASNVAVITTRDFPYKQVFISVQSPDDLPRL